MQPLGLEDLTVGLLIENEIRSLPDFQETFETSCMHGCVMVENTFFPPQNQCVCPRQQGDAV